MIQTVKVIARKGKAVLETSGFSGPACKAATAELSKKLGVTESDEETEEFYAVAHEAEVERARR